MYKVVSFVSCPCNIPKIFSSEVTSEPDLSLPEKICPVCGKKYKIKKQIQHTIENDISIESEIL